MVALYCYHVITVFGYNSYYTRYRIHSVCVCVLMVIHRLIRFVFFIADKRNRREMTYCAFFYVHTFVCIVCLRFSNSREKHEISVYARASHDDEILYSLPAYLRARVCTVTGHKLVSIMSSDRHDGNIRDERNIELDEKRRVAAVVVIL